MLQLFRIRHVVRERSVAQQVNLIAGFLEFSGYDVTGVHRGDAESHQGGRYVNVLEGSAHRVLAADGRQTEGSLHLQCSEQGAEGLSPGVRVGAHALEVFLIGETHPTPVRSAAGHLGACLHNRIRRAVEGAPEGQVGIEAEGHHAGRIGDAEGGQFLHRDLGFAGLAGAAVRHKHRGAAYGGIEHLHQTLLRGHVGRCHSAEHLLFQGAAFGLADKGIALLHRGDGRFSIVARAGAVDEFAGEVADLLSAEIHAHAAGIGNVGHVGNLHVVGRAERHEALFIGGFYNHGHALLRFADGKLGGIEAGIFHGNAVQIDVEPGGELADSHAHAAGTEVVRLLDKARHLLAPEQALQLAFLGGIALLHLGAAGLERSLGVLLGGTCGTAYAVAAGAAAKQQYHVACRRRLPTHIRSLHGANYCADFHTLRSVTVGIDFTHVGGGKAYLVAVAGIASSRLAGNHALRELARDGVGHLGGDVACTSDTHRLIYICTARQRVADGAAETGRRTAEGFYFSGMVVSFVLEHQEPLLHLSVHVHVHVNAAGVVLLALLHIVQQAL